MKPTRPQAIKQITRLRALPKFDVLGAEGIEELARVLVSNGDSAAHIERAITAWIDGGNRWLPTPADLIELLSAVPGECKLKPAREDCALCRGCGFMPTTAYGFSGYAVCDCRIGKPTPTIAERDPGPIPGWEEFERRYRGRRRALGVPIPETKGGE